MASTKLADRFWAWRLTIGVSPLNLEGALARCEELGLDPRVCGYQGHGDVGVLFTVVVPKDACRHPQPDFMKKYLGGYGALVGVVSVQLICPVP